MMDSELAFSGGFVLQILKSEQIDKRFLRRVRLNAVKALKGDTNTISRFGKAVVDQCSSFNLDISLDSFATVFGTLVASDTLWLHWLGFHYSHRAFIVQVISTRNITVFIDKQRGVFGRIAKDRKLELALVAAGLCRENSNQCKKYSLHLSSSNATKKRQVGFNDALCIWCLYCSLLLMQC